MRFEQRNSSAIYGYGHYILFIQYCILETTDLYEIICSQTDMTRTDNNDDISFFSVYERLPRLCVIMCCSPHRFAVGATIHYHIRAWQTSKHGKECFILLLTC